MERFKCSVCGKLTAGRRPVLAWNKGEYIPSEGKVSYKYDTSFRYPRRHNHNGQFCKGSLMEAERVVIESK